MAPSDLVEQESTDRKKIPNSSGSHGSIDRRRFQIDTESVESEKSAQSNEVKLDSYLLRP